MELIGFLEANLYGIVILFTRISGLFVFMPGFSSKAINRKVKVLLTLTMSILINNYTSNPEINSFYMFFARMIGEFIGGTIIGLTSNLFMQTIQIVGSIADSLLGMGIFQAVDTSGMVSSVSVKLIEYLALLLFFISNSHLYIMHIISMDIDFFKLYPSFSNGHFFIFLIEMIKFIFINGLHLAMPFVVIFLLIDICLGIMNRSFQSFNVFLFSMPVKMLMFVMFLFYYLYFFKDNFGNLIAINFDLIKIFLHLLTN